MLDTKVAHTALFDSPGPLQIVTDLVMAGNAYACRAKEFHASWAKISSMNRSDEKPRVCNVLWRRGYIYAVAAPAIRPAAYNKALSLKLAWSFFNSARLSDCLYVKLPASLRTITTCIWGLGIMPA